MAGRARGATTSSITSDRTGDRCQRLAAGCAAVTGWTLAATAVGEADPAPYVTVAVGTTVLALFVAAAEIRRSGCLCARLAAGVVALLVVAGQLLAVLAGPPGSAPRGWSAEALVTLGYGACVPALLLLAALLGAPAGRTLATAARNPTRQGQPYAH